MPELPEVETVRRGLAELVVGRPIVRVEVGRERSVRRTSREAVIAGLTGTTMLEARRRGKYLVCDLDSGDAVMVHLRMSGQLLVAPAATPRPPHTHVTMILGDGSDELRFVDPRTFGEVVVFDPDRAAEQVPELGRLGVDPVLDPFDATALLMMTLVPFTLNCCSVTGVMPSSLEASTINTENLYVTFGVAFVSTFVQVVL